MLIRTSDKVVNIKCRLFMLSAVNLLVTLSSFTSVAAADTGQNKTTEFL